MIIEMYIIKNEAKKPDSVTVTLTPETIAEEDSLRNATIFHKNSLMAYWGDTIELSNITGSLRRKDRKEIPICMDGLKINLGLPKPEKSQDIDGQVQPTNKL